MLGGKEEMKKENSVLTDEEIEDFYNSNSYLTRNNERRIDVTRHCFARDIEQATIKKLKEKAYKEANG